MIVSALQRLQLLDYRRSIGDLYVSVRAAEDPRSAWLLWRSARDEIFRSHPQSPIPNNERGGFAGLAYFDYDPAFRVMAEVSGLPARSVEIPGSGNRGHTFDLIGRASFTLDGESHSLDLYWLTDYAGGLFVSYRDLTSGRETYESCRYLLDTAKGADLGSQDDRLILDFNFSYQPSCSYDPNWSCPLAPRGNYLEVAITAGERTAP